MRSVFLQDRYVTIESDQGVRLQAVQYGGGAGAGVRWRRKRRKRRQTEASHRSREEGWKGGALVIHPQDERRFVC